MDLKESLINYFELEEHNTDFRTEVVAGITTFLAMSYIVVVNPDILSFAIKDIPGTTATEIEQMLAVVTILSSAIAIFIMAFYANRPFALAPGLALNAFFAFTVVGQMGIPWQTALAAVVVEGVIFIILTAIGAREYIIQLFPEPVKFAVGTGIGLFLTIIGLQEMHIVVNDKATLVQLGNVASDPIAIVSVVGLFITIMLYANGIPGSIIIGIGLTSLIGWGATFVGLVKAGLLAPQSLPAPQYNITPLVGSFIQGFQGIEAFSFALIIFTFFFVDFFDTAGTLTGVSQIAGFLDEEGNLPEMNKPLMADAIGTTIGGMLGTSTVTTFIESSTGVEEGGRTGLTAAVVGVLFLLSLVFVPLAAAIPIYASHIALVMVGLIMLQHVVEIAWNDLAYALPAGMTITIMPLTFSIAYGIAAGIITYPLVMTAQGRSEEIHPGQWVLAAAFILYFVVRTGGFISGTV